MNACRNCGREAKLHHGLCEDCTTKEAAVERVPTEPSLEPAHDRPWVARSAFVGRKRRSPRT
ncbi:MAG: hypothetical protein ACHQIG_11580 [Acidimicrobiia bacterium]